MFLGLGFRVVSVTGTKQTIGCKTFVPLAENHLILFLLEFELPEAITVLFCFRPITILILKGDNIG